MSKVSEKVVKAYTTCDLEHGKHDKDSCPYRVLADALRNMLARALKAEHEQWLCARTNADWKALAENQLRGEK